MDTQPIVIESCHSTWIFDADRLRFRRILRGTEVGGQPVVTGWRSYSRLVVEADSETFTVILNVAGSRMIRSWRHDAGCTQCGQHMTSEMSLDKLRAVLGN